MDHIGDKTSPTIAGSPASMRSSIGDRGAATWSEETKTGGAGEGYRADIDGLRALAIVPVVLFHLDVAYVRGGYIGVDVFFVISGYLITRILQTEIASGRFSIVRFYDRRIRRIFPALFAVFIAATAMAYFVLFPPELLDYARSVIAATLFFSNMYFMRVTDYFNIATDSSPFLHTWSLAVEEQFYIVLPVLLYYLRGFSNQKRIYIIACLALASFALSVELVRTNQIAAFYIAPSRAWELLIGTLLALDAFPKLTQPRQREVLAALGMALIVAGCFKFYRNMPFPGVRALVPCLGAAALIHAGASGKTVAGRVLSTKPVVFVGLISFSLYLWHWPIIVFARLLWPQATSVVGILSILAASVAAGVLSWRYIERPFREKTVAASPTVLRGLAGAGMAVFVAIGFGLISSDGLVSSFPKETVRLTDYLHYDDRPVYRRDVCFLDSHADALSDFDARLCLGRSSDKPNWLLIGDSHAAHLWSGLTTAMPAVHVLQATASGCKPVFGTKGHPSCLAIVDRALEDELASGGIDAVVLSAQWEAGDVPLLVATVDRLAARVKRIYVSGPIVEYRESLPRLLAQVSEGRSNDILIADQVPSRPEVDALMAAALKGHSATYLSPYQTLCPNPGESCRALATNGIPMQWDYGHLTAEGSNVLVRTWLESGKIRVSTHN